MFIFYFIYLVDSTKSPHTAKIHVVPTVFAINCLCLHRDGSVNA